MEEVDHINHVEELKKVEAWPTFFVIEIMVWKSSKKWRWGGSTSRGRPQKGGVDLCQLDVVNIVGARKPPHNIPSTSTQQFKNTYCLSFTKYMHDSWPIWYCCRKMIQSDVLWYSQLKVLPFYFSWKLPFFSNNLIWENLKVWWHIMT